MKLRGTERIYQWSAFIIIAIISLVSLYPIIYVTALSLTSEVEWAAKGGFVLWPDKPTLLAYAKIMQDRSVFLNAFGMSVLRTVVGTILGLSMTLITGYVVSRKGLPGRRVILFCILITILFNGGLIPTYLVVKNTGLYNTFWALIVPMLIDGWSVLVFKQFFENIPKEIEESAQIDGVGEFNLMLRIIIPMSLPVMAALGLFMAVAHWNSWFDALIYLKDDTLKPLQLIMRNMFANANFAYDMNSKIDLDPTKRISMTSLRMAVAVIGTLPILLVYPFLQKHFIKGVYIGAVKG